MEIDMTDNRQPEALRLAELLELAPEDGIEPQTAEDAAAELRRQHARIAELEAQLEAIGAGGMSGQLMGRASLAASAGSEPVATVFTMDAQAIPGVQWQCGPQASGFTAPQADIQPARDERDDFEKTFPLPSGCIRVGTGYASTGYSNWAAHTHCERWQGWRARAARAQAGSVTEPAATVIKKGAERQWMSERLGHLPDGIYSLYLAPLAQAADSVLEDAARYRWLRKPRLAAGQGSITVELDDRANGHFSRSIFLAELDAAIDAARAAQEGKT
jgi:hypothetical protein